MKVRRPGGLLNLWLVDQPGKGAPEIEVRRLLDRLGGSHFSISGADRPLSDSYILSHRAASVAAPTASIRQCPACRRASALSITKKSPSQLGGGRELAGTLEGGAKAAASSSVTTNIG